MSEAEQGASVAAEEGGRSGRPRPDRWLWAPACRLSFKSSVELREGQPGEPRLQGFTGCLWLWVGGGWGRDGSRETGAEAALMCRQKGTEVEPAWELGRERWLGSGYDFKIPDEDSHANLLRVIDISTSEKAGRGTEHRRPGCQLSQAGARLCP